jgi:Family of unknown function (DUF5662)
MPDYDSTQDTLDHIKTVQQLLLAMVENIHLRSEYHDKSKLETPEKMMLDRFTPLLKTMTYGSERYKDCLTEMGAGLQHHYLVNTHHPEHFVNGIAGMTLLDLVEMLADWKAAGMRHADGSMAQSMQVNRERFQISDQLYEILCNTVKEMGW